MGSDPNFSAHIAQSVEHFLGKEEVTGSIPVVGSMVIEAVQALSLHEPPGRVLIKYMQLSGLCAVRPFAARPEQA
jgi:hypothetical protein